MPNAVDHRDVNPIGNSMGALDGAPGIMLHLAVLRFFRRMPSNGRWIKEHMRSLQRGQARALGVPLVPANQRAYSPKFRIESLETEVPRSEIVLFVIQRIVGDMHLAIDAQQLAVSVNHGRGVVIDTGRPFFKNRSNY